MIEHRNINPDETGLSIRAKINRMFSDLISGVEGVNKLWKSLIGVNESVKRNNLELFNLKDELQNRFSDVLGYTDREVNDILNYVNGMCGGINGFADTLDFQPNYPKDSAATVIGVGPGTFTNMLGENGNPITVDAQEVVIFFKAAGNDFWKYKTVLPTILQNDVTEEFGDSSDKVISQRFFTEKTQGVVGGVVEITDIDSYDTLNKSGLFSLRKDGNSAGTFIVSGDLDASLIYQFILGGFSATDGSLISSEGVSVVYRIKNLSSVTSDVEMTTWSSWRNLQDNFMEVISEDEYEAKKIAGTLIPNRFYFLYEEEQL